MNTVKGSKAPHIGLRTPVSPDILMIAGWRKKSATRNLETWEKPEAGICLSYNPVRKEVLSIDKEDQDNGCDG